MNNESSRVRGLPTALLLLVALLALALHACTNAPPPDAEGSAAPMAIGSGSGSGSGDDGSGSGSGEAHARAPQNHTITAGDTLYALGLTYGCTLAELQTANGMDDDDDTIVLGKKLVIPPCQPAEDRPTKPVVAGQVYIVQPGDYLEVIAINAGCSVPELMQANKLTSDAIYIKDELIIPVCAAPRAAVAQDPAAAGKGAKPVVTKEGEYLVQPGDSLGLIASKFDTTIAALMAANKLDGDKIRAYDTLVIPKPGAPIPAEKPKRQPSTKPTKPTKPRDGKAPGKVEPEEEAPPEPRAEREPPPAPSNASLDALMASKGFRGDSTFKAYVIRTTLSADRSRIVSEKRFDYRGTGDDVSNWNPASTVKLFAAIAAMKKADSLGFTGNAEIQFGKAEHTRQLKSLIQDALGPSNNIAYDFLATFVGHDELNGNFFTRGNGFQRTALRRAYESSRWMQMGFSSSLAPSPRLLITEGSKSRTLDARLGTIDGGCYSAACTSLHDLAEAMRRLMLQEQLPGSQSFRLKPASLTLIRNVLRSARPRGQEVVDAIDESAFGPGTQFYHKAGYAGDWFSDNIFVKDPSSRTVWVVAMANYPGRGSLSRGARVLSSLIGEGALDPR
jgi:LysM repeat protein